MISRSNSPVSWYDVRWRLAAVGLSLVAAATVACNKAALLAPTNSTITLIAGNRILPTGGTTELTATVLENSGQPVPNGTTVRFTASLGRVDPVEAETQNGVAIATFVAGADSGVAEIRAISGLASGGTGTGTGTTPPGGTPPATTAGNVVLITIGAAAVETVVLRANPGSVGPNGGDVTLTALVTAASGQLVSGVQVAFASTQGQVNPPTAITNQAGEATTTLTTDRESSITATAGSKTSAPVTVAVRTGPAITMTCAAGVAQNCASVTIGQPVTFTVTPGADSSRLRQVELDFGDGTSLNLGAVTGATTVGHTYGEADTFTARATATDTAGEQISATQFVEVRGPLSLSVVAEVVGGAGSRRVRATADPDGEGSAQVVQFEWTFQGGEPNALTTAPVAEFTYDSSGTKTVSVRVTLTDGRTATASTSVNIPQ